MKIKIEKKSTLQIHRTLTRTLQKENALKLGKILLSLLTLLFYSCDIPLMPEKVKLNTKQNLEITEEKEDDKDSEVENIEDSEKDEDEHIKELAINGIPTVKNRKWNIFIYMSADNNLESSALEDFCEIELSKIDTDEVSIFVLLDRSAGYDTSENNWSGTRLYKIKTNRTAEDKYFVSEEIECPPLSLSKGKNVVLDLSNGYVLTKCLAYIMEQFPAEHYGMIMWGHGTGWRNETSYHDERYATSYNVFKGFAFDDSSKTYMTLKQLGVALKGALNGRKLSFLGFDTCFGGEIEIFYELKDCANYCVASEGLVMANGWNYTNLFNNFSEYEEKTVNEICTSVIEQFANLYGNTKRASIVAVDMSKVDDFANSFIDFSKKSAKFITTKEVRNNILGVLYSNNDCKTERYSYGASNSDVYLDIFSMCSQLNSYFGKKVEKEYSDFRTSKEKVIVNSWASDREEGGIGVYFNSLAASGSTVELLSTTFPSTYIKEKTYDQIAFVTDFSGYCPTIDKNESLLDKLFYTQF